MKFENQIPKYSKLEIEKRWLVHLDNCPDLSKLKKTEITDKYFQNTRTRLRKMFDISSGTYIYKLCKKYGKISDLSEPITNLYLSENEYISFNKLEGQILSKNRYQFPFNQNLFSIDKFISPKRNFYILELEQPSETDFDNLILPNFIGDEVSMMKEFEGYSIVFS